MSLDEVRVLLRLARLRLTDVEIERTALQLGRILDYAAKVGEVDVAGVEATTHAMPLACPARDDRPGESLPAAEAVRGAPQAEGALFAVPRIIG